VDIGGHGVMSTRVDKRPSMSTPVDIGVGPLSAHWAAFMAGPLGAYSAR
jgi:hypothetical protein